ncbi:MAG: DUF5110 domain-containing protein [Bacteroidetes bacterium]|nr:DUF5110 domain-containing protein [Bacteroidota bacterium]
MKAILKTALIVTLFIPPILMSAQQNPLANPAAIITDSQARFTVLTPEMIRLEWGSGGKVEDHASFVFLNRNLDVPAFTVKEENGWLVITTEKLRLRYLKDSGKFTAANLLITLTLNGKEVQWKPGMKDSLNLHGTTRTLDGWNGGKPSDLEPGLISQSGWALVDDSESLLFDDSDWPWVMKRPDSERQDWYFLGYGHDYKKCLADYTRVAGKIPIPPMFAFGYWWSRYWVYSDSELRELCTDMKAHGIPMDVLIIDMDWHKTYDLTWSDMKKDPFGQPVGWTGYTWNRDLFPEPGEFLQWTARQKLKTALNLHPASGIPPMEEQYDDFAKAFHFDTTGRPYIPFQLENKEFAKTYFNTLLKPFEDQGIDFWWLDWQQWPESKTIKGLSNTWWLNYAFFTNMERNGKRPLLFHRWGGLGNHRYQIGFSGDAIVSWQSLAFEPYFTATASNVGYGYWSHDIGGHNPLEIPTEPELYLRWLQFGALSPILRTHATKSNVMERRFWMFPDHFQAMKEAIQLRYALVPYIYSCARLAYDEGLSICRPMYYEWPEKQQAYDFQGQYYFGDDILVVPVTEPINENDLLASMKIWLPEGDWYEYYSGELLPGNQVINRKYAQDEIPLFIKAGAIIPMNPEVMNLQDNTDTLVLFITPGGRGETVIYDDDRNSPAYKEGQFTRTKVTSALLPDQTGLSLLINAREGSYRDMPGQLSWEVRLPSLLPPIQVTIDGKTMPFSQNPVVNSWYYLGKELMVIVKTSPLSCTSTHEIILHFENPLSSRQALLNGKTGQFRRLSRIVTTLKQQAGSDFFIPDWLYGLEQTYRRIDYHPQNAESELIQFESHFNTLARDLATLTTDSSAILLQQIRYLSRSVTAEENDAIRKAMELLKKKESRVSIRLPYAGQYAAGGKLALMDGKQGSLHFFDGKWQGYEGVDLDFTYDMENECFIRQVKIGFLENQGNWIFFPKGIEIQTSKDGVHFETTVTQAFDSPVNSNIIHVDRIPVEINKTARFIRIIAKNQGICPKWHQGAGEKAWLFADEIEIIKK